MSVPTTQPGLSAATPDCEMSRLGHCPACGAGTRMGFGRRGELCLWRCCACGLVYLDPQPRERVARKYTQTYDLAAHFEQWEQRKAVLYERRLRWLPGPGPRGRRVCDVGCADGQFLELAARRGWEPHGVELNPPAAARARSRGAQVYEGSLETVDDLPWGTFDLVTAWDCIEHTPEPAQFASRLARLLAPGGTLALTTLNVDSLVARTFRTRWSMVVEDHFTYWDTGSLRGLMEACGLRTTSHHCFGLGRDFVTPLDRLLSGLRRDRDQPGEVAVAARSNWDARRPVLLAEAMLNRVLDRTAWGVGQALVARLPD